jgi:CRISPR/Cas system CMR-associated protein Cmr5 small subunit
LDAIDREAKRTINTHPRNLILFISLTLSHILTKHDNTAQAGYLGAGPASFAIIISHFHSKYKRKAGREVSSGPLHRVRAAKPDRLRNETRQVLC